MIESSVFRVWLLFAWLFALPLCTPGGSAAAEGVALVLDVKGAIGPATADYIHRGIDTARLREAGLVILRLDTPGGLDTAMRDIIQDILTSPVAVAAYVAPSGARAASAGTYILYASHVAAMAPGTNLGAATPVELGGTSGKERLLKKAARPEDDASPEADEAPDAMERKRVNDAAAYIRSLAQLRGRNAEWAERAVREAASLSAEEAANLGVVDLLATDDQDLLRKIQGRTVKLGGAKQTLETRDLRVEYLPRDWRSRLLGVITDPNVAYILMLIGIWGLFFEFANPGVVAPGVVGAISLLLALYAFQILPVNYAGLALVGLGLVFMLTEAFVPSFGALGIGGLIAFVVGSLMLFDQAATGYAVSLPLILSLAVVTAGFFLFIVGAAIKARRRPVVSGAEELLNTTGEAVEDFERKGRVRAHGEIWLAETTAPLKRGDRVRVIGRDGLVLRVQRDVEEN